jgi:ATP-binding protein involved in chromosome partitioning
VDPRIAVIDKRLENVRRIVAITGGKGGIGKSVLSSTLALTLAAEGRSVGLLDLDLTAPCAHFILGIQPQPPKEDFGIVPPSVGGVRVMSVAQFIGSHPAALRGADVTNALIEMLCITRWGELDFLIVDMPPGLGDVTLDLARLLRRAEYVVVATASRVVMETVHRTVRLLNRVDARILGCVANMEREDDPAVERLAAKAGIPFLGSVPFDAGLEAALGDVPLLNRSVVARALREIGRNFVAPPSK